MWCGAATPLLPVWWHKSLACPGARHLTPAVLHFMCRKTAVGVFMLKKEERQLNVCLVGSIDIFPWVQEKATYREGELGGCNFVCVCLQCMVIRWVQRDYVTPYRRQSWGKDRSMCVCGFTYHWLVRQGVSDKKDYSSCNWFRCMQDLLWFFHQRISLPITYICTFTQKKTQSQTANRKGHLVARRY